jgi:drug/metabolite transporter (DMT)-like permease
MADATPVPHEAIDASLEVKTRPTPVRPTPAAVPRVDNIVLGIVFMIAATFLFAGTAALAKWLARIYPVGEVMFFRSASSFVICATIVLPMRGFSVFATKRPRDHLARGFSQSISQTFTVLAVSMMPLAGAIAINFSAPLWSALLSVLWLKEKAGPARWTALLLGFVGVLIVTHPGADSLQLGALYALGNAILYGTVTVAVRGMTATESTSTLLMWQLTTLAVLHSFLLIFGFRFPTFVDGAMLVLSGIANVVGQWLWTKALVLAPTTAVSPFYYLMLVWALVLGFLVWGDLPTPSLVVGSGIVVACGLFLLWYESQRSRQTKR